MKFFGVWDELGNFKEMSKEMSQIVSSGKIFSFDGFEL